MANDKWWFSSEQSTTDLKTIMREREGERTRETAAEYSISHREELIDKGITSEIWLFVCVCAHAPICVFARSYIYAFFYGQMDLYRVTYTHIPASIVRTRLPGYKCLRPHVFLSLKKISCSTSRRLLAQLMAFTPSIAPSG